jgi:hypothetical protein
MRALKVNRGANPLFYSNQFPHDASSSTKNKISSLTPNQNEKYPNPHTNTGDPWPRETWQTHAGCGFGQTHVGTVDLASH